MTLAPNSEIDAVEVPSGTDDFVAVVFASNQREAEKHRVFLDRHDVPAMVSRAAVRDNASDIAVLVPAAKLELASDLLASGGYLDDASYSGEIDLKDGPFDDDDDGDTDDDDYAADDDDDDDDDMDDEFYDDDDDELDDDDDDSDDDLD